MKLSMTSDYVTSQDCPEPYLRRIAEAGFTHIHWCHQWHTDFLYNDSEIAQIAAWMKEFGLGLTDLHASAGKEKNWGSLREYERQAGVDLVRNRIDMTARLGSDVVIMHVPVAGTATAERGWEAFLRSLDELKPFARERGVRIAIENGDFDVLERVFGAYGPDYMGLCYDSGHGNGRADGGETTSLDRLSRLKDRLISLHLHDNDGASDQHKLLFSGTVDWPRLAGIIATSSYSKWVSMEAVIHNTGIKEETVFLHKAYETGRQFADMIAKKKA